MSDEDGGLFSIAIDSDEEGLASEAAAKAKERPRDYQTEEQFQELRATYRVKEQNGDIWQAIELPLIPGQASKPVLQEILHAVEELYFLRRFDEAAVFTKRVLDGSDAALDRDTRELLIRYEEKCRSRMAQ
ncbi:uncharacterized protein CTRU02_200256 [Colletotrichum truncatum]|uniref:Uncharacterized protein n=1 Tax=Colletotrichum truncatum TaxID=5467 RepID=A0ACC3ZE38_COLTU|nr:uncharacterized protein CTRU02_00010 [Colletotrichum truncatum]KAF6801262.1 hypothetical protein CTRU02_00010 [Colletotrichum truncatum]